MQQYFAKEPLQVNEEYTFTKEQAHHAKNVVRLNNEVVRLVYEGKAYFARCHNGENGFQALVLEEDPRVNELHCDVILAMALIRREKFEFVLQKATELGVRKIIPFESSRCVVRAKAEKKDRQLERWNDILQEASEQCKRNEIPEITNVKSWNEIQKLDAELKLCAYENAYGTSSMLSDVVNQQHSILVVIGPEGGFSQKEVEELSEAGFESVTFGNRILRAETAAMYACGVLSELDGRLDK